MIHYVKEKKETVHFSHLQYYNCFIFHPISFYIVIVSSSYSISIVCLFIYVYLPRGPVQCILGCSLRLHFR